MSDAPERTDTDISLELHFLPAWAQRPADQQNRYSQFEGEAARDDRRRDWGARPQGRRPDRPPEQRGPRPERGPRPGPGGSQAPRVEGRGRGRDADRRHDRGPGMRPPPPPPVPFVELNVAYIPDEKGVDSLSRQIRMTGRAYPLFDIAHLILAKPERYTVTVSTKKKADGGVAQPLFLCAIDDTLWLSEDEAVQWSLEKHFDLFYQSDRTKIEPPKGTYTFVAQCGMTGAILGPPNYHDYQNRLRKLYQDKFGRMPFDAYKSRVKIVRDEAVVKQWLEEQSWKTEFVALNVPEAVRLGNREEVEQHFREVHLPNIIKSVETHRLTGPAARNIRSQALARLARHGLEEQRRFPLQIATVLSQQFAARGLQFFKVNRTVTHVSVSRPHFLDLDAVPVSEGIRKIVEFINSHPKSARRALLNGLAPNPAPAPAHPPESAVESQPAAAQPSDPTPEQTAIASDLHWLIHQGHVIEFANGILDTAKRPVPKPPRPAPKAPEEKKKEPKMPDQPPASVETVESTASLGEEAPPPEPASAVETPEYSSTSRTEIEVSAGGEAEAENQPSQTV